MRDFHHYFTVADVSAYVGLTGPAVLALIHNGDLIASNVSSGTQRPRWRVAPDDLSLWLTSRQARPTPRITRRRRTATITEYV